MLRLLKYMRHTQALAYLQAAHEGAEVVFGGDLNWIEEEQGELPLPEGWCALLMPRLQLRALLVVWGSAHWREGWAVLLQIDFVLESRSGERCLAPLKVAPRTSHAPLSNCSQKSHGFVVLSDNVIRAGVSTPCTEPQALLKF